MVKVPSQSPNGPRDPSEGGAADPSGLQIRPVEPDEQAVALSLLTTGTTEPCLDKRATLAAIAGQATVSGWCLWGAYLHDKLRAAALMVPCAGRSAMCFISHVHNDAMVQTAGRLVREACLQNPLPNTRIIQALVEPDAARDIKTLETAGFSRLAELLYMSRRVVDDGPGWSLDGVIRLLTWDEKHRQVFEQAIQTSYEQTLDCPRLLGLRRIEDVLASHMATGRFEPDRWLLLVSGDDPVAVMLINPVPDSTAVELVYLGVSPGWRGRGIGRKLVEYGLSQSAQRGAQDMILAVDRANEPALRVYRALGFSPRARKLAMLCVLTNSAE